MTSVQPSSYQLASITDVQHVTNWRLVLGLECGYQLVTPAGDNFKTSASFSWNLEAFTYLFDNVLPWSGVFITDIAALSMQEVMSIVNRGDLTQFKGRLAKIVIHGADIEGRRAAECVIGKKGATIHLITGDYLSRTGDIRRAWESMLMKEAELRIEYPDFLSVPLALGYGRRSCFDEIVLVNNLVEVDFHGKRYPFKNTGYTCMA